MNIPFIVSSIIFLVTFFFILTEKIHRTVIALLGGVLMIILGTLFNFYSFEEAIHIIDFDTIILLFGMMVIVAVMEKTGFFQYLAIIAAKKTKGDPWKLVVILGTVTTLLSLVLNNVTTIILIAPITIIIARLIKISPSPILMAEALLSDTGGVATLIGDPPNIIIGNAASFSFNDFLTHSAPIVFVAWLATLFVLRFVYNKDLKKKPENIESLLKMDEVRAIKDRSSLKKTLVVLFIVIILFFLSINPALVALIGASLVLILVSCHKDPQPILKNIEWSILLFFMALFVVVGGLEHAGVLSYLASLISNLAHNNIIIIALIILWASAFMSAIVDNIPFTIAMVPVISYLENQGVPVNLLWWSLVLGVGFGGNGTPIGSTANLIVIAKSEQTNHPITFREWLKTGSIAAFSTLMVASLAIILFSSFLEN